ncbi:protein CHLOROPLAST VESICULATION [Gastrolobium bilobum]|uniref:protein CHLOROPLAST VESICULATION n=1 Tax=Gastrolobium bilobum TaxID=150636 RepID=UPI002AB29B1A|nr:protein CHLOROPLAST VESICULATION [Gastrolobium bilobum]
MRTNCCLSLPPPTSNASLVPVKPPHVSLVKNEGCWRRQCFFMGVTSYCTIIVCNSVIAVHEAVAQEESNYSSVSVGGGAKWSEKRACPPWRGHSLETIVPENLPRPAARRRYETVRSNSKTAPPLTPSIKLTTNKGSCFSM